jgi:hypothetical protein
MNAPARNLPGRPPTGRARRRRRYVGSKLRSDAQPLVAVPNSGEEHRDLLADRSPVWDRGDSIACGFPASSRDLRHETAASSGVEASTSPWFGPRPRKPFDALTFVFKAAVMTSRISHTSFDARDAYAQSLFWAQVLDFIEDPDDPNEPAHQECLIMSRDRSQLLLFITVPDSKTVKNRMHLDLRPADRTREEETERILALGASQLADHRRADGSGWITSPTPRAMSSASCPRNQPAPERRLDQVSSRQKSAWFQDFARISYLDHQGRLEVNRWNASWHGTAGWETWATLQFPLPEYRR